MCRCGWLSCGLNREPLQIGAELDLGKVAIATLPAGVLITRFKNRLEVGKVAGHIAVVHADD
jgi:hypothetical protein